MKCVFHSHMYRTSLPLACTPSLTIVLFLEVFFCPTVNERVPVISLFGKKMENNEYWFSLVMYPSKLCHNKHKSSQLIYFLGVLFILL